jgi:hypothetical protein
MPVAVHAKDQETFGITDIDRLARFLRVTYGAQAINEAQRRVDVYTEDTRHEVAQIWRLVLMYLRGKPVTDDTHRILKAKRNLTVKKTTPPDAA